MDKVKHINFASSFILYFLFLLCFSSVASSDLESDKKVLLAFAGTVHHSRKLNWNSKVSVCSWVGVTCTPNRTRVLTLHLPGVGLLGSISPNTLGKLRDLRVLSLRSNRLYGNLPSDIFSLPFLRYLNLQNNNFSGQIPVQLSSGIISLDLSHNFLSGKIPEAISNLSHLSTLNLQNNIFSGQIPDLELPRLMNLNLSNNNLNGTVPIFLQKFPAASFLGNSKLCGPPLPQCFTVAPSPSPLFSPSISSSAISIKESSKKKINVGLIVAIATGVSAVLLLCAAVIIFCFLKRKDAVGGGKPKDKVVSVQRVEKSKLENSSGVQTAERNKLVFFESCSYIFDLEDLLRASAEVLGKGSYGTAYKASLEDGTTVVVKRLKEVLAGKREFEQQMELLGRIGQHPNLVPVRAYYYSKDEKLLVCNYFPSGSFASLLHGNRSADRTPLDWDSRVKIVLGTAYGIAHIHSEGGAKCTHGNIKSSNVLLDQNLNALVSDYGLCALMTPTNSSRVFVGYRAPETIETGKITQKSDIYSFGVLLLEMLTGKSPLQAQRHNDVVDLPRWVKSVVKEEWTAEVFDVELMKSPSNEEKLVQMLQLAMACLARFPDQRPHMGDVIRTIEDIKLTGRESCSSSDKNRNSIEQTL